MYKPKILVVEDDPAINNLIRTTLETQEYQYHTAQNGSGALMEVLSYKPDVVILDLGLPDMDGVSIIEKIRSWSSIPTVSYTHLDVYKRQLLHGAIPQESIG